MSNTLVIVESPAKAKTIKKYLPRGYTVEATMGHVIDLPKSRMGIDIENHFEPEYIKIRGKGDILKTLKKAAKNADHVLLATDPDREGEAISWHVANYLDMDPTKPCRIEFHEITKNAIREAIKNKRPVNMDLVDAQQGRRVLDRLVGYSISPILWQKIRSGLSAGRVQSVATKLIVDKEKEIEAFIPEEYWEISADLKKQGDRKAFKASLHSENGKKCKISNEAEARRLEGIANQSDYVVKNISDRIRNQKAPLPFTTSTLQQSAYQVLGFSTQKTMRLAQQLYEGVQVKGHGQIGLVTYIRTDSTRLADEAKAAAKAYITNRFGKEYLGSGTTVVKKKGVQDAHEAIRPAYIELTPEEAEASLEKDQYKLYKLIWERMMSSQMADAQIHVTDVVIGCGVLDFKAQGEVQGFAGWTAVSPVKKKKESYLPSLEVGETVRLFKLNTEQKFTQPPARYTEGTLVKALEDKGIGRPSTYSPIIGTIRGRGYVDVKQKHFYPTELGYAVTQLLEEYFKDEVDVTFTAKMENNLDEVAEGEQHWKEVIENFYKSFGPELETARKEAGKISVQDEISDELCPECGRNLVIKRGKFGKFLACPGFPDCKYTKAILNKTDGLCPDCGSPIVERRSKRGKVFYGCGNFPKCHFALWDKPVKDVCPDCGNTMFEKSTGRKNQIYCVYCSKTES